jgi:hypothetical protein
LVTFSHLNPKIACLQGTSFAPDRAFLRIGKERSREKEEEKEEGEEENVFW